MVSRNGIQDLAPSGLSAVELPMDFFIHIVKDLIVNDFF